MLKSSSKRKIKSRTHKAVRENIQLNKSMDVNYKNDLWAGLSGENNWVSQQSEINLIDNINTRNISKKGKLIVKWWEN